LLVTVISFVQTIVIRDDDEELMDSAVLSRGNVLLDASKHWKLELLGKGTGTKKKATISDAPTAGLKSKESSRSSTPTKKRATVGGVTTPL
jgi:hypothetical protein